MASTEKLLRLISVVTLGAMHSFDLEPTRLVIADREHVDKTVQKTNYLTESGRLLYQGLPESYHRNIAPSTTIYTRLLLIPSCGML